ETVPRRRLALRLAQRLGIFFDAVEEHAYFCHSPIEHLMHEVELLSCRQAIVGEVADIPPETSARIRIAQAARDRHRTWRERSEQLRACPPAADLAAGTRLKIAVQHRASHRAEWRLGRKTINHRHVFEDEKHPIPV